MRGKPFVIGNRMGRGRPRGSKNRKTTFQEALEGHGDAIVRQCIVQALKGDPTALRLCVERLIPPCKLPSQKLRIAKIKTAADLETASYSAIRTMSRGGMTPQEGQAVASMLDTARRLAEAGEFSSRLQNIEDRLEEMQEQEAENRGSTLKVRSGPADPQAKEGITK